jgi:hypothetical protein
MHNIDEKKIYALIMNKINFRNNISETVHFLLNSIEHMLYFQSFHIKGNL